MSNSDFYAAERAVQSAVQNNPELLEKIRADDAARHKAAGNGGGQGKASAEPAWPELKPEALYGLVGDIVRTTDPFTEADPVATSAL